MCMVPMYQSKLACSSLTKLQNSPYTELPLKELVAELCMVAWGIVGE